MTTDSSTGDWTPEREQAIRERCEKATPGPWTPGDDGEEGDFGNVYTADGELLADLAEQSDAAFIAHAREDLPAALAWGEQQAAKADRHAERIVSLLAAADAQDREIERLRDLLREAEPRIKPAPIARHPEDWEPDDLRARIQAATKEAP